MASEPPIEYAGVPLPEVQVFTNRLLNAETTENVLNALNDIENIRQINMTGESVSKVIGNGPAKGMPNNHEARKTIKVKGKDVELKYQVGAFYIELDVEDEDAMNLVISKIKENCDKIITHGYSLNVGRYTKYRKTLTDYRGE